MSDNYSTLRIEAEALEKLRVIADRNRRSMASQIAHWVDREWEKLNGQPEPAFIHNLDVAETPAE